MVESHEVLGGKAKVLRTRASGKVYQLRMWIERERKYVRETLRTKDLETAIRKGEERVFQIYSDVHTGRRIFGITLGQLVKAYLDWRKREDVETKNITEGRWKTLSSHLKHLLNFKGPDTKLSELDKLSCYNYAEYRRKHYSNVRDVTIRNEEATINHMMKFAYREKYNMQFETFEFRKTRIRNEEVGRRDTFSLDEYDKLISFMRSWSAKKNTVSEQQRLERLLVRDCILIASNTMLRVGELWQLKWGDILGYEDRIDESGKQVTLVRLRVRAETAKTRRERVITVRGGEYFKRLKERALFKGNDEYIFCGNEGNEKFPRNKFYLAWNELMKALGIDYKGRNITWYSCRHFGITCRLRAGASAFDLAKIAGTGISFIQNHYGHFDQEMSRAVALKNFSYGKEGISTN